jgi:hypothetical protein
MASIDRTAYPRFSYQLSARELDARYGPTDEETTLTLAESLGASARLPFLVMLKTRQQLGYFPLLGEVPEQIVTFLCNALDLPAPLTCPTCGAQMRIVAFITEAAPVQRILSHIGESTTRPPIAPARGPPSWEEEGCGAIFLDEERFPGDPLAQPEPEYEFDQRVTW